MEDVLEGRKRSFVVARHPTDVGIPVWRTHHEKVARAGAKRVAAPSSVGRGQFRQRRLDGRAKYVMRTGNRVGANVHVPDVARPEAVVDVNAEGWVPRNIRAGVLHHQAQCAARSAQPGYHFRVTGPFCADTTGAPRTNSHEA